MLELARQGELPAEVKGVGCRQKIRKFKYCLAEAARSIKRTRMLRSRVVALHSDARKGRLAVRYTACGADLKPEAGILGTTSLVDGRFSTDSVGITNAIMHITKDVCTPSADHLWPGRLTSSSSAMIHY